MNLIEIVMVMLITALLVSSLALAAAPVVTKAHDIRETRAELLELVENLDDGDLADIEEFDESIIDLTLYR